MGGHDVEQEPATHTPDVSTLAFPDAVPSPPSPPALQLGVSVAAAFLLPQLLWGWDQEACLQLVLPMAGGWFLFDITFCAALLYKLRML